MHSLGPDLNSLVRTEIMVSWIVLLAFAAFVIIVLMLLVKRFGALRTFGWGFSIFVVGLLGLLGLSGQVQVVDPVVNARSVSVRSNAQVRGLTSSGDNGPVAEAYTEYEANLNAPISRQTISSLSRAGGDGSTMSAWDENIAPVANIYPGIPECGRPLAFKLVDYLREQAALAEPSAKAEVEEPSKYRIAAINRGERIEHADFLRFLINFREEFTSQMPGSTVEGVMGNAKSAPRKKKVDHSFQNVQVTVYPSFERTASGENVMGGTVRGGVRIEGKSGHLVCLVKREDPSASTELLSKFIEKPWVADPEQYMSRKPSGRYAIGFSSRLETSEQEARKSALKDVNVQLARSSSRTFADNYDMEQNVLDRFVQKLKKPYGNVWREAVLLDLNSPEKPQVKYANKNLAIFAAKSGRMSHQVIQATQNSVGSNFKQVWDPEMMVAGLMLLTVVIGWISNRMTQGYYRGPVWTVTGTLFSIGFLLLIFFVLINFA